MAVSAERQFRSSLKRLESTRQRIERVNANELLARQDIERVYEGLFLSFVTGFEQFLEGLFFEVMLDQRWHSAKVTPKASFKSARTLRDFVLANNAFADWLPYSNTERRAKIFLRRGRPFTEISKGDRDEIQRWMAVRNAIAHASEHSNKKFREVAIGGTPLPPRQRNPAGWLRSSAQVGLTRFELTVREAAQIAYGLAH